MIIKKNPQALEEVGRALYGQNWKGQLRRDLGIKNDARIRDWIAGRYEIPDGVWLKVIELLKKRQQVINDLLSDLE